MIHYTDWCDYHEILDTHANMISDIEVQFIHDRSDKLPRFLKSLCSLQLSRKLGSFFPIDKLKFINNWRAKEILPQVKSPETTCLIFSSLYAASIHASFWAYLRNKGFKLVLIYVDRLKLTPRLMDIDLLRKYFDLICTYNSDEAKEYHIEEHPIKLSDLSYLRTNKIDNDIYFIGSEKGRINEINALYDACCELGLKSDFYVAGYNGAEKRDGINYITKISYEESLQKASHSKAIVNLLQPGSSGFTLRDIEAYNLGSYIVTNNKDESISELYQKEQVININEDSFKEKLSILKNPFERFDKKNSKYTYDYFYSWINDRIQ